MQGLNKQTFQYLESEVYSLHDTLKEIKMIELNLMDPYDEEPDNNVGAGTNSVRSISNPTMTKATTLVEHRTLKRMREKTEAILKVYNNLLDEKKEVIRLYYWERPGQLTWRGIAEETNTSRATALRWRKSFIYDIAKELGEM